MENKEEDIHFEYLCEIGRNSQESEQQEKPEVQNLVKIGAGEISTYASVAVKYMEEHGSAVIAARGNRCGKAIMVYRQLRDMGLISADEGRVAIGVDPIEPTKTRNGNDGILTLRVPFIRITVFPRRRYNIFA